jgi:hypothetical protein
MDNASEVLRYKAIIVVPVTCSFVIQLTIMTYALTSTHPGASIANICTTTFELLSDESRVRSIRCDWIQNHWPLATLSQAISHGHMDRDLTQFFNWLDQSNAIERRHRCRCRSTKSELAIERETIPVKKCVAIGSSTNQMTVDILYIMSYFGCHDERLKWLVLWINTRQKWLIWSTESCHAVTWKWYRMTSKLTIDTWKSRMYYGMGM